MFRYIVAIWSAESEEQACAAQSIASRLKAAQWDEPMRTQGMRVFQMHVRPRGLATQVLPSGAGVVIGRTFERVSDVLDDMPVPQWSATPFEADAILASRGRWLMNRCWGNYVAVLRSSASRRIWVVKDPAGNLPCFVARSHGVTLIFSFVEDLVRLGLCSFTIDRAHLRARLLHGASFQRPPLNEIDQVRRGECVELDPEASALASRQFLWFPQAFTHDHDAFDAPDEAASAMRASVRMSTHTLAALDRSIVHRLSGELGASIIAGCLRDAPNRPRVCCYTHFNPAAPSDDRHRAHALASQLCFEHLEVGLKPQDIQLSRALQLPLQVAPVSILSYALRSTIEQEIATATGASIVIDGDGGDAFFGSDAVHDAATEYVRRKGLNPEVLRIASHVAMHTHRSTWSVLYRALAASLTGAVVDPVAGQTTKASRLISADALEDGAPADSCPHPWFAEGGFASRALAHRLKSLLLSRELHDVFPGESAPEAHSPLCSQPVVETLLRIPPYRLFEGGHESGLARRAFAKEVPEQSLTRCREEQGPEFCEKLVSVNRPFLREILLDGLLVREGLLDRGAVEQALADEPSRGAASPDEIMQHFDVETWMRAWASSASQPRQQSRAAVIC